MDDVGYNDKVDVVFGYVEVVIVVDVDDGDIIVVDVNNVWEIFDHIWNVEVDDIVDDGDIIALWLMSSINVWDIFD